MVQYPAYYVNITYTSDSSVYYASISCADAVVGRAYDFAGCFEKEFTGFYRLLQGQAQTQTYEDFFAPVYVLNAIYRSMESGKEEKVNRAEEI